MCSSGDTPDSASTALTPRRRRAPPSRALLCEIEPLHHKDVTEEIRGHKDLQRIAESAPILPALPHTTPKPVVEALLDALVEAAQLPVHALSEARAALYSAEPVLYTRPGADNFEDAFDTVSSHTLPVTNPAESAEIVSGNSKAVHWHRHILGRGFLIPFARINALDDTAQSIVAIARLRHSCNLGTTNDTLIRFVAIVLGPMREVKETKSPFELARTLSSKFQDDDYFLQAKHAENVDEIRLAIKQYLTREKNLSDQDAAPISLADITFRRTGKFAGGLIQDIKSRYNPSMYKSDWIDGMKDPRSLLKYLSTIVWLFFAIIMPTIAFGALNNENTDGYLGVIETIVSQAFAGLTFAVFAGQPLTIVMTTAPLTVFIDVLFRWSTSLEIEFLPFYAWTGIWTAVILLILVVTDACAIMKYCGHFTEEIFATLIAALFISEYIKPLIKSAENDDTDIFLLNFLLASGTFLIAAALLNFRRSFLLRPIIRQLLSDFGIPIAIVIMSALRQPFNIDVESLSVPERTGIVTTRDRPWFVALFSIQVQHIFLALVSGALLATLFFLDQNISSMLVNKAENKLKKRPGYYLDLVVVSIIIIVQSLLGMPWTHAALPHSPLHARQLADVEEYEEHGRRYERVVKARETRVTGFLTHVLIFLSILAKDALGVIPLSVLWGFFLFLGAGTLDGNALWERVLLIFTQPEKYPPNHYVRRVKIQRIHLYTLIQVSLLILLWFVKSNFYIGDNTKFHTGLLFPFVIALFIPVRLYILPRIFKPSELYALSKEEGENVSEFGTTG